MRERDINHKDKQNYDAVLHITSTSVLTLLSRIPDAKGTLAFLNVIRCVIDSYLDKRIDAASRVEKAWYAVFFMRYWRQWLLLNPHYTLGNNFITPNAYMCIELNAHSLITFLMTVRDSLPPESLSFLPWMLGSQSCERIFRAARSMSSTFSTVINFGMLGLLRRLHRMHIQLCLEAESEETGIKYPRIEAHKNKDGHHKPQICSVSPLTNQDIVKAVQEAKEKAKTTIKSLGMAEVLQKNNYWENPPISVLEDEDIHNEDNLDLDEEAVANDNATPELLLEANSSQDPEDVASGISQLSEAGVIGKDLAECLMRLHKSSFKRLPQTSLPIYQQESVKGKTTKINHCPFVEIKHNGNTLYIHKTTAVWLLQEGERVSSDRLFRVRSKQPYACEPSPQIRSSCGTNPIVCQSLQVGNICVFIDSKDKWKIGRVLQFSYYLEKTKSAQQYRGLTVNLADKPKKIGVLCSWYTLSSPPATFSAVQCEETHIFHPVTSYVCTLLHGCFENIVSTEGINVQSSIINVDPTKLDLATAEHLTLHMTSLSFINKILEKADDPCSSQPPEVITINDNTDPPPPCHSAEYWIKYGGFLLTRKDLQLLLNGKELTDQHVNAFQSLLKRQFPHIRGLQNTHFQTKTPLQHNKSEGMSLQIIHIRKSHWAALQVTGDEIYLYDSAYMSTSADTLEVIAQLVRSKDHSIKIQIMNTSKQTGAADCALYAMATITSLALDIDPLFVVFNQEELRPHLAKTLETGKVTQFPTVKRRRPATRVSKVETL